MSQRIKELKQQQQQHHQPRKKIVVVKCVHNVQRKMRYTVVSLLKCKLACNTFCIIYHNRNEVGKYNLFHSTIASFNYYFNENNGKE